EQHELAERHHADPADEQSQAERDDAVDHDASHDQQPVRAGQGGDEDEGQEHEHHGSDEPTGMVDAEAVRGGGGGRRLGAVDGGDGVGLHVRTTTWRRRLNQSSATMASTKGVMLRYWARSIVLPRIVTDPNACSPDWTIPMTKPAASVTQSERSWPISAAASAGMTRNVSATYSNPTRLASSRPENPHTMPDPNQAAASTRRT